MANIISTSISALSAAQAGLATTAHNIANANTVGYNRQLVLQAAIGGQDEGGGFIGKGTEVVSVRRVYNEYLAAQTRTADTKLGQLQSHFTLASRINNLLGDSDSGMSPVLQDFFKSVQNLASNPDSGGSMLAAAESMAARFQSMDGQLREIRVAVNTEIATSVDAINSYAKQIADLNKAINAAKSGSGQLPNDLLDQRDYLIGQLSKETKVTVTKDGNNYGVFIGNGQPLVVGSTVSKLAAVPSATDANDISVGLVTATGTIRLSDNSLQGGRLAGLFEFRSTTLTNAENSLGRIALGLASTFNAQHHLGMDQTGSMGGDFFNMAAPVVNANLENTGDAVAGATITDATQLKVSDYKMGYDGTNYIVTRLSDNKQVASVAGPGFPAAGITVDGVNMAVTSGTMAAGDNFLIRPNANGAAGFSVLVSDISNIATATPVISTAPMTNSGTGVMSDGTVDANFDPAWPELPVTMSYDATTGELNASATGPGTGFPFSVKITKIDGTSTIYGPGTPVPYTSGATITFGADVAGPPVDVGGITVKLSGALGEGDDFTVQANPNASGDNRNTVLLGSLQTANTLAGGTTTYQGALGQMVSAVGNKTHELEVGQSAQSKLVTQLNEAQQSDSGVNLDEEGANLLRYQQAYTAASKVMQAVKEMFDVLASLGN